MLALTLGLVIQGTPINVESPGIRMVNLIPKLASEARLALSVVPALENDVVAIRTMGRPWGEVKANLAKVLNATWEEKDGRFVLTQTPEQQAADLATRYECMKAKIQKLKSRFEPFFSADEWTEREFANWHEKNSKLIEKRRWEGIHLEDFIWRQRSDPNGRFAARLLHSVSPSMLTGQGLDWERTAYSDLKLPLHTKLDLDTRRILHQLNSESELVKSQPNELDSIFARNLEPEPGRADHWTFRLVERSDGNLSVDLWLLDAKGAVTSEIMDLTDEKDLSHYEGLGGIPRLSKFTKDRFASIDDLYLDSRAAVRLEKRREYDVALKRVLEFCEELKKTGTVDPLAYLGGDEWRLFSEEKGAPMISLLADASKNRVVMSSHPKQASGSFRAEKEGWIVGMQRDPYYVRSHRVDRQKLASLLAQLVVYPIQSQDDLRDIDKEIAIRFSLWQNHLQWMPDMDILVSAMVGWVGVSDLWAIYAELDEATKGRLLNGQPILLSRQSEGVRRAFREMPFRGSALWGLDDRLPAVAFPGIDDGMMLWAEIGHEEGYVVRYQDSDKNLLSPHLRYVDFDGLAFATYGSKADKKIEVARARRTQLILNLQHKRLLKNGPRMTGEINGFPRPTSAFLRLDQLPKEFRKKLEDEGKNQIDYDG